MCGIRQGDGYVAHAPSGGCKNRFAIFAGDKTINNDLACQIDRRRPLPLRGGSGGAASGGHKRMAEPAKQAKPLKIKHNASHESCRGHGVARDYFVFLSQNVFGIDVNGQPFQYVYAHAGIP